MAELGKRLFLIKSGLIPDMPAKFHRRSLSGSAQTSKTGTDRPTEFAIAVCHLANTKCHKNLIFSLESLLSKRIVLKKFDL